MNKGGRVLGAAIELMRGSPFFLREKVRMRGSNKAFCFFASRAVVAP
jgi:hypothetical protein